MRYSVESALASMRPCLAELRSSLREGERLELTPHLSASGQLESLSLCLDMPWGGDSECSLLPPPGFRGGVHNTLVRTYVVHILNHPNLFAKGMHVNLSV